MCDTLVALPNSTTDGRTLFGKNSDRPPNEPQVIRYVPKAQHDKSETVKCTYISIPQVKETYAVYLSSPFWLWGAEMGANEYGVAIGNEAVFSNEEVPEVGLLGMDLLRLGLERAKTARNALDIITSLLEKHGQGGICELGGVNTYHNSFLIADRDEAWVLETSDRRWVAQRVDSVRSISNGYTIHSQWDLGSKDVVEHAMEKGWTESKQDFDFAAAYGNEALRYIARCDDRLHCSADTLEQMRGKLDFFGMASILRNHPDGWTPWNQEVAAICQHAGPSNSSSTTGSQISEIGDKSTHWFIGSSNPCMSVYWPFEFDTPYVYSGFGVGDKAYSAKSYWWRREKVNRALAMRFGARGLRFPDMTKLQDEVYHSWSKRAGRTAIENAIQKHEKLSRGFGGKEPYRGWLRSRIRNLLEDKKQRSRTSVKIGYPPIPSDGVPFPASINDLPLMQWHHIISAKERTAVEKRPEEGQHGVCLTPSSWHSHDTAIDILQIRKSVLRQERSLPLPRESPRRCFPIAERHLCGTKRMLQAKSPRMKL